MGVLGHKIRLGASAAGDYEVKKSLRFDFDADVKLSRTPSSSTNSSGKGAISFWMKLSGLKTSQVNGGLILAGGDSGSGPNSAYIQLWDSANHGNYSNGYGLYFGNSSDWVETRAYFKDHSAWYHVCCIWDTSLGTQTDRMQVWINNERAEFDSFISWPTQNESFDMMNISGDEYLIGRRNSTDMNFDGYLAEWHFVDGTVKAATDFAETNDDTGQWVPKKYDGVYGTNGFYLNFSDSSGTTATTLGKDSSGNGNNWTPTGFSVAAGTGCDSYEDTPTNNFPTFNQNQKKAGSVVNGALDVNYSDGDDNASNTATMGMRTGKWYYEITDRTDSSGTAAGIIGVCPDSYMETKRMANGWPGFGSGSGIGFNGGDQHYTTGSNLGTYGGTWTTNDVIGVAVDADAGKIALSKNGQWADGAGNFDEAGITGGAQKTIPGDAPYFAVVSDTSGSHDPKFSINFGQRAFAHTPPAGYKKLCTKNLPEPPSLKASDYFNTKLYTGNNSTQVISGVGFKSDIAWFKPRSINDNNVFWRRDGDATSDWKYQYTNGNGGESGYRSDGITAWGSDGYTLGNWNNLNTNNATMVIWSWKKSATAGLDIVKYTGNGSARAIDHNLNAVPEMMWVKRIDGADNWMVYHKAMGNTHYVELNGGNSYVDFAAAWNDTSPTSTQFTVGTDGSVNGNGQSFVAYLFSSIEGYSKVGSFKGNGAADGPFVYTGFRPQFLCIRSVTQGNNWAIFDNKRDPYNSMHERLHPNTNGGTNAGAGDTIDFYSNGFKCINSDSLENPSSAWVAYMAFAKTPYKYSNAY